jgi:hypothetical protein
MIGYMCATARNIEHRFIATITFIYASRYTKQTCNANIMTFIDCEWAIYLKHAHPLSLPKMQAQHNVRIIVWEDHVLTVLISDTNLNCRYVGLVNW